MSDRAKRLDRMYRVRERVAEWAAEHHPDLLRQAMECWIGPHSPEEALINQAIDFAVIAPFEGRSIADRCREAWGKISRADREVFKAWSQAWFAVLEIEDVLPGEGFLFRDALTDERIEVLERSASMQFDAGGWLAGVLIPVGNHVEMEGSMMALKGPAQIVAVQAFAKGLAEPSRPTRAETMARMEDVVRAVRDSQRAPQFVNHDGDAIQLITVQLGPTWEDTVSILSGWEDTEVEECHGVVTADSVAGQPGLLVVGTFNQTDDGVELFVNSEGRLERVLQMWRDRVGSELVLGERIVQEVPSDPDGPKLVMDSSVDFADQEAMLSGRDWPDEAIPALDGLTPRQAVACGRTAEVRALLPDLHGEDLADLREELGIESPARFDVLARIQRLPRDGTWEARTVLVPYEDGDEQMLVFVDTDGEAVYGYLDALQWSDEILREILLSERPHRPKRVVCRQWDVDVLRVFTQEIGATLAVVASLPTADGVALSMLDW